MRGESEPVPAFFEAAFHRAEPDIQSIRARLPSFPSPPLRVQRVGQLDADLLDQELADLLAEPVKAALRNVSPTLDKRRHDEIYLFLRLILYKFSIFDRSASYGAMLQNLKYRNEWAHRAHLQSTAVDAPLSRIQLALYPLITIIAPYAFSKAQAHMTEHHFDRAPTESPAFALFSLSEQLQRVWHMASLLNFGLFLWNGKYRTITDRLLGMRLTYANRALHRNVSFEFLNRQLVWNAFTEFLLFLLPLIRPQRIWRRIARWPTHPWVLRTLYDTLPTPLSRRLGLQLDEHTHAVRLARRSPRTPTIGKYWYLPDECCALCFQRLERAAGVEVDAVVPPPMPRHMTSTVAIPTADPLHPRRGLVARRQGREREGDDTLVDNKLVVDRAAERALKLAERRAARQAASARPAAVTEKPSLYGTSPNGIAYMDALLVTPYQALPCASQGHTCRYCYYCIADKLLDDAMADELQDTGGWPCLRCGEPIWGAERVVESATA